MEKSTVIFTGREMTIALEGFIQAFQRGAINTSNPEAAATYAKIMSIRTDHGDNCVYFEAFSITP